MAFRPSTFSARLAATDEYGHRGSGNIRVVAGATRHLSGGKMDFFLHHTQMGEAVRHKRSWVREYTPRSDEERDEEIRARIAANRAAEARQETPKEEK
jgi:hypothetical protein